MTIETPMLFCYNYSDKMKSGEHTYMNIIMAGIDHSTAAVEIRERFSFLEREKTDFLQTLCAHKGVEGCILLCTCNRTELWLCCEEGTDLRPVEKICEYKGTSSVQYEQFYVTRTNQEAIHYLFEMTSGLHSLIVGEDQILTQVKKALSFSREQNCCGSVLDVLFRTAITAAKKVKTELSISTANASAVNYAIDYLAKDNVCFSNKKCLVIGNGEMGKRAATALLELGAEVTVTVRQYRSGVIEVVPGCHRINYAQRYDHIPFCDIVVSATSSPNTTITAASLAVCGVKPGTVFIDLAVPRDIEPAVREIPGTILLDIDSFSVPKTEQLRQQLAQAEILLKEQELKFRNWLDGRNLLPEMEQIGDAFAEAVLFRMGSFLKALPQQQRDETRACTQIAASKEIRKLLFHLRDEIDSETFHRCVRAIIGGQYGST